MSSSVLFTLCVVVAAGIAVAMQGMVNAALGRAVDSALAASALSFGVGFIALVAVTFVLGDGAAFARLPSVPVWLLAGGLLGAFFVWSIAWGVPTLGAVSTFAALILGQMIAALLLDATGIFGLASHDITLPRIAAVLMVAGGVVLSRL